MSLSQVGTDVMLPHRNLIYPNAECKHGHKMIHDDEEFRNDGTKL